MRGYIKDHRQEINSDIWKMPPLYHRVWQWLKYKVNYEDAIIPFPDGSRVLVKAGQHLTSVRKIAQGVGWHERGVWKEPNSKTISKVLEWLKNDGMITVDGGNRKYTLVTLVNWRFFQHEDTAKVTVAGYKEEVIRIKELRPLKDIDEMEEKEPMEQDEKIKFLDTVFLTQDEYDRLCNEFGKDTVDLYIEMVDEWQTNYPKKARKDHNKTIRVWIKKDANKPKTVQGKKPTTFDKNKDLLQRKMEEARRRDQRANGEVDSFDYNSLPEPPMDG